MSFAEPPVFMKQTTDIHPAFGLTLSQTFQRVEEWDPNHSDTYSHLYRYTNCHHSHELLGYNPFAIPLLHQHPEYARDPYALRTNGSEGALELLRGMTNDTYEARDQFELALIESKLSNLDTYLTSKLKFSLARLSKLATNKHAFRYISKRIDLSNLESLVTWCFISANPESLDLLEEQPLLMNFFYLSMNPNPQAIAVLRQIPSQIRWYFVSANPCDEALDLLEENPDKICFMGLHRNTNPRAIALLRSHPEKIFWPALSMNSSSAAVQLLEENQDKVSWRILSNYAHTSAQFALLRSHVDKVDWVALCQNPSPLAVALLAEHPDKVCWFYSLKFQPVFHTVTSYDYAGIRVVRRELHEEFHAWACHPSMVNKWRNWQLSDLVFAEDMEEEEAE